MSEHTVSRESHGGSPLASLLMSPILWGGALTVCFYAAIPQLPVYKDLAERYFCGHPIEYATTYLFFVGIAVLGFKGMGLSTERAALGLNSFFALDVNAGDKPLADQLQTQVRELPRRFQTTIFATRLSDVAAFLRQKPAHDSVDDHLRYLAERAAEKTHSSYALVRTVTWAVPILGFLGTVIGITMAIANISPDQLQNSLTDVISGLSVSFDTTALALALSLILVFGSFVVERMENQVLDDVEEFGVKEITCRLPSGAPQIQSPLLEAESKVAEELLLRSREMVDYQSQVWQQALEGMRQVWLESLSSQESELNSALATTVEATLKKHEQTADETRVEFLEAFNNISRQLTHGMNENRALQAQTQADLQKQMESFLREWRDEAHRSASQLDQHTRGAVSEIVAELHTWQKHLHNSTQAAAGQMEELHKQTETLERLLAGKEDLARFQERLSQNLAAVTAGNKLEEVLHNLNAAIHLLTARSLPRAA